VKDFAIIFKRRIVAPLLAIVAVFMIYLPALAQEEALIAAVVNDHSISSVDLAQRTNLVLFATALIWFYSPRPCHAHRKFRNGCSHRF
jgi:hypothetical protein